MLVVKKYISQYINLLLLNEHVNMHFWNTTKYAIMFNQFVVESAQNRGINYTKHLRLINSLDVF